MSEARTPTQQLHDELRLPSDGTRLPLSRLVLEHIQNGADINAPDEDGLTPLLRCLSWTGPFDLSFSNSAHEVLSALLANDADLEALSPDGRTAEDLAANWDSGRHKVERERARRDDSFLKKNFSAIPALWPKPSDPADKRMHDKFLKACNSGDLDQVRYITYLHPDAPAWVMQWQGRSVNGLFSCVSNSTPHLPVAAFLLRHGCDINWQNETGGTALMEAVSCNWSGPYIPLLIRAGADETLKSKNGDTAMDLALGRSDSVHADTFKAALAERVGRMTRLRDAFARRAARGVFKEGVIQAEARQRKMRLFGGKFRLTS